MNSFKKVSKNKFTDFINSHEGLTKWHQTIADRIDYKDKNGNLIAYKVLIDGKMFIAS